MTEQQFLKSMEDVHTLADCVELYVLAENYTDASLARFALCQVLERLQKNYLTPAVVAAPIDAEFTFNHNKK